jgi:hypothetical protein
MTRPATKATLREMTAVIETDRPTKRYRRARGSDELSLTVGAVL